MGEPTNKADREKKDGRRESRKSARVAYLEEHDSSLVASITAVSRGVLERILQSSRRRVLPFSIAFVDGCWTSEEDFQ